MLPRQLRAHPFPPAAATVLFGPITSYYSYIETAAYKPAHYFGFVLGDQFLCRVVPGYQPDHALSISYGMELRNYLEVDTQKLVA